MPRHHPDSGAFVHVNLTLESADLLHLNDLRNLLLDRFLDTHFEGHGGHGAGTARPLQPDLDDIVSRHFHQFHITAVTLQHGADLF